MKVFKGCALAFLSFILFFLLCIFGIAYTVNQVALNPHYINKILNDVNFSQVIQEQLDKPDSANNINPELKTALIDTFKKMEPVIKQQVGIALDDIYAYMKGQGDAPNLKDILAKTVMNSDFVAEALNEIDLSNLLDQVMKEQETGETFSDTFENALVDVVDKSEPALKKQIVDASGPIFDYILMKSSSIDLKSIARQTFLSEDMVSQILNSLDYTTMTQNIVPEYLKLQLPENVILTSQQMDLIAAALQPVVKTTLTGAAGNFADYLTGNNATLAINLDLTSSFPTIKTVVKEAFLSQLPAYLQGASATKIDNEFEKYYADLIKTIPTTYEINSTNIDWGTGATDMINQAITNAQNGLTDIRNNLDKQSRDFGNVLNEDRMNSSDRDFGNVLQEIRTYIGYFRLGYACLIALIVLLIAGIILIYRNVKDACLKLGIVFTVYGALAFAVVLIAKFVGTQQLTNLDIPQSLHDLPGILLNDVISPLRLFSLTCLIGGIILIIVSIVYPKLKPAKSEQTTPPAVS